MDQNNQNVTPNNMPNGKMKKCSSCGADIAASAKACPHCGAKNKKPIYKRAWFIIIIIIAAIAIISSVFGGNSGEGSGEGSGKGSGEASEQAGAAETEKADISYTAVTSDEMVDALEANALSATETYEGAYIELTGKLSNIDSSGEYISLDPLHKDFNLTNTLCYLKNDEQRKAVKSMSVGDTVVLRGKVKSVGEVLGYSLDIISFVK